jgi:phosphatidylserine/phosphatidylglycerophosphate/cardiolipin synthase-like enzyme
MFPRIRTVCRRLCRPWRALLRTRRRRALIAVVLVLGVVLWAPWPGERAMPPGTAQAGPPRVLDVERTRLLFDLTGACPQSGERMVEQTIFDDLLRGIAGAEQFIALDFFLWNDWTGQTDTLPRPLARELAEALIARKTARPALPVFVVTDPVNRLYGRHAPEYFARMAAVGIHLVYTDLSRLPESNILFGRPARRLSSVLRGLPGLDRPLWFNPVDSGGDLLTTREWARLLRFKANHRKLLVADDGAALRLWVTSWNPAGGSAWHDNVALSVTGAVALDALESLHAVWNWSACGLYADEAGATDEVVSDWERVMRAAHRLADAVASTPAPADPQAQWLGEGAIRDEIVRQLDGCQAGDEVAAALFYLSDRVVLAALRRAVRSGAGVRLILDVNRDAFGREKIGVPNRPVAAALMAAARRVGGDLQVRWAATRGEQFHLKAMAIRDAARSRHVLLLGSANWTRRNVGNYNLEANLLLQNAREPVAQYFEVFERLWNNASGIYTEGYENHAEEGVRSWPKAWLGRVMEATGAGTH